MSTAHRWSLTILFVILCSVLAIVGCGSSPVVTEINKFVHTEVKFPEQLQTRILRQDTLVPNFAATPVKLVIYINSTQCDDCNLKILLPWKHLISELESGFPGDSVRCLFVFHPRRLTNLESGLLLYSFNYPVLYDETGTFELQNTLPSDPAFHTFLLDRENRVVLVGSPVGNPKMWALYKRTIGQLVSNGGKTTDTQ